MSANLLEHADVLMIGLFGRLDGTELMPSSSNCDETRTEIQNSPPRLVPPTATPRFMPVPFVPSFMLSSDSKPSDIKPSGDVMLTVGTETKSAAGGNAGMGIEETAWSSMNV